MKISSLIYYRRFCLPRSLAPLSLLVTRWTVSPTVLSPRMCTYLPKRAETRVSIRREQCINIVALNLFARADRPVLGSSGR